MTAAFVLLLAAVSVTFQPSSPTVGDLITLEFAAPVKLEASQDYEIVSQQGRRVIVRTFRPAPFVLHGETEGVRFQNLIIPVRSVLDPKQPMTPAPLVPPREVPYPRQPFIAIALGAAIALASWLLVWRRSKRPARAAVPAMSPEERFRTAVAALRAGNDRARWATLADETRHYLAATRPGLGEELTTRELIARLGSSGTSEAGVVSEILRQGDLEKFSTRGATPLPFDEIAVRALLLLRGHAPAATEPEDAAA
jgi:hypothetical protein